MDDFKTEESRELIQKLYDKLGVEKAELHIRARGAEARVEVIRYKEAGGSFLRCYYRYGSIEIEELHRVDFIGEGSLDEFNRIFEVEEALRLRCGRLVALLDHQIIPRINMGGVTEVAAEYEILEADNNVGYYFVLKAANGEIVATSEVYTTKDDARKGAEAAKRASEQADG